MDYLNLKDGESETSAGILQQAVDFITNLLDDDVTGHVVVEDCKTIQSIQNQHGVMSSSSGLVIKSTPCSSTSKRGERSGQTVARIGRDDVRSLRSERDLELKEIRRAGGGRQTEEGWGQGHTPAYPHARNTLFSQCDQPPATMKLRG